MLAPPAVDAALETGSDKRKGPKGLASMGRKTWLERISDGAGVDRTAAVKIFVREHKNVCVLAWGFLPCRPVIAHTLFCLPHRFQLPTSSWASRRCSSR